MCYILDPNAIEALWQFKHLIGKGTTFVVGIDDELLKNTTTLVNNLSDIAMKDLEWNEISDVNGGIPFKFIAKQGIFWNKWSMDKNTEFSYLFSHNDNVK